MKINLEKVAKQLKGKRKIVMLNNIIKMIISIKVKVLKANFG